MYILFHSIRTIPKQKYLAKVNNFICLFVYCKVVHFKESYVCARIHDIFPPQAKLRCTLYIIVLATKCFKIKPLSILENYLT